jgi:drug/metabolite transporter (DMT)-like permease
MSAQGRPGGVTLVGVLIVIAGIFGLLGGLLGLFNADARAGLGILSLLIAVVVSVIYLAVAKGIFDGNNFSRLLVGIVTVINLIGGVIALIFVSAARVNGFVSIIFALIILALLYNRRASAFFAAR